MTQSEFVQFVVDAFDRARIVYAITGSHAGIAYGEHRFTNDLDVVTRMGTEELSRLIAEFPSNQFYVSDIGARHAVTHGGQFNIIHPESGNKVDVIVPAEPGWPDQLARRRLLPADTGCEAWFVAPEDLILRKMHFYQIGGSEKHMRDIAAMLKLRRVLIDRAYVNQWAETLGLNEVWAELCKRVP